MKSYEHLIYDTEDIPLSCINIGRRFDRVDSYDLKISELAKDIEENGMHTEIWVKKEGDLDFQIISGYRRLLAHKELNKKTIRARIYSVNDIDAAYMMCSENSNRINYSKLEKIDNFLYLLHKEFLNIHQNIPDDFIPARYLDASKKTILALRAQEMGRSLPMAKLSKEQKALSKIIIKVHKQSGLFSSYNNLYLMIKIEQMSKELKRFCVSNVLSIGSMNALVSAEMFFDEKYIVKKVIGKENEKVLVFPLLLEEIKKLEKITLPQVTRLVNKHKRVLFTGQVSKVKFEDAEDELSFLTDDLRKLLKDETTSVSNKKRVVKLFTYIEKEITKIRKQHTYEQEKQKR